MLREGFLSSSALLSPELLLVAAFLTAAVRH